MNGTTLPLDDVCEVFPYNSGFMIPRFHVDFNLIQADA